MSKDPTPIYTATTVDMIFVQVPSGQAPFFDAAQARTAEQIMALDDAQFDQHLIDKYGPVDQPYYRW